MKKLQNLTDAKILSRNEQLSVKGGQPVPGECHRDEDCPKGYVCWGTACFHAP